MLFGAGGAEGWVNLSLIKFLCMACSSLWLFVALSSGGASQARVLGIAVFCYVKLIKLRRKQDKSGFANI